MSIVIPPGFAHVDFTFRHSSYQRDAHITYGINVGEDPSLLAQFVLSAWMNNGNGLLDSNVTMREVTVTIGQDGGEPLIDQASNTTPGARSGDASTVALAALVTKRTGLGGRRNTGRMFLPWCLIDTEVSEVGIINANRVDSIQQSMNNHLAYLAADGVQMVILHRTGGSSVPDPTPVTSIVASNVVSTQRRRQVRNV